MAGRSLSFVLLTPPAAPSSRARSPAPCFSMVCMRSRAPVFSLVAQSSQALGFSLVRVHAPELRFLVWTCARSRAPSFSLVPVSALELQCSVWSRARSQAHGHSPLSCGCWSASPACSPVQLATASLCLRASAPSPFRFSSDNCAQFHGSLLRTSIFSAGDVRL